MCEKAVQSWGVDAQLVMVIEECSELTKEVTKKLRGHQRPENMKEELADVLVMCEQLRIILGLSDEDLEKIAEEKMLRAMKRGGIHEFDEPQERKYDPHRNYWDACSGSMMVP